MQQSRGEQHRQAIRFSNRLFAPFNVNVPRTATKMAGDDSNRSCTREAAAFPAKWLHDYKFWPQSFS